MLTIFNEEDIPLLLNLLKGTDARFLLQFAGPRYKYPLDKKQILETMEAIDYMLFKFIDDKTGEFLGHCQLVRIDDENKKATVGRVLLDPNQRGRGLGKEMISNLITFSREKLRLRELDLRVYDFNKSALKCYENLGFKETTRQSKYFESVDEAWISITMSLKI